MLHGIRMVFYIYAKTVAIWGNKRKSSFLLVHFSNILKKLMFIGGSVARKDLFSLACLLIFLNVKKIAIKIPLAVP